MKNARKKRNESKCSVCAKGKSKAKKLPYGAKRNRHWCTCCDANHVQTINKKSARQINRKLVEEEIRKKAEELAEREFWHRVFKF